MASFYIENLGCAKNQVDAEVMGHSLQSDGWRWSDDAGESDLIIVNTCGFIEPAQQESIDTTLSFLNDFPDTPVVLAGCMAQRFADELAEGLPEVLGIFGNREPYEISAFLKRLESRQQDGTGEAGPVIWLPPGRGELTGAPRGRLLSHPGSAYLKIAEGCNHNCTFCAIPSIRGGLRTRSADDLVSEFRLLRDRGIFEFNLIAQDLAAWTDAPDAPDAPGGPDGPGGFPGLLKALLSEPGDFWLRPLYLYPDTFPPEVIEIAAGDSRLLPYFDLSFQHASRKVLHRMGRPGDADAYLELIHRIRDRLPDVALRSSFIVGFPGETDRDVEELLDFIRRAALEWVGVFQFSPQTGTPAEEMASQVSPETAALRKHLVESAQEDVVHERLSRFVGKSMPVLAEERIDGVSVMLGRSPLQAPDVDGLVVVHEAPDQVVPGNVMTVTITGVTGVDLQGRFDRLRR
jgi:ribosomal protein S12 methylthiotransferase